MSYDYSIMNIGRGKISKIFPMSGGKFSKIIKQEYEIKKYKNI